MIEQRKARRFELELPLELIRIGSNRLSVLGWTKNISSIGVLFVLDAQLEIGDSIEYVVLLPTGSEAFAVRIRCLGKVVRSVKNDLAATLERYEFVRTNRAGGEEEPGSASARVRRRAAGAN